MNISRLSELRVELMINEKLYKSGVINFAIYSKVNEVIFSKIKKYKI